MVSGRGGLRRDLLVWLYIYIPGIVAVSIGCVRLRQQMILIERMVIVRVTVMIVMTVVMMVMSGSTTASGTVPVVIVMSTRVMSC